MLATVDYAKSGQTLELLSELSPEFPTMDIRLVGVQAPDREQDPWGEAARQCLADLAKDQVRIEPEASGLDRYNRLWASVWAKGTLINAEVLAQGCAFLERDRPWEQRHATALIHAQEEARLLGRGIWNPANPLRESPRTFRQNQSSP